MEDPFKKISTDDHVKCESDASNNYFQIPQIAPCSSLTSSSDTIHQGIIIVVTRGSHTTQHGHRYTGRPFDLCCAVSIANMYLDKGGQ